MKRYKYSWTMLSSKDGRKGGKLDMKMGSRIGLRMVRNIWRMKRYKVTEKEQIQGTKKQGSGMQKWKQMEGCCVWQPTLT
jgi:hypothetical protein